MFWNPKGILVSGIYIPNISDADLSIKILGNPPDQFGSLSRMVFEMVSRGVAGSLQDTTIYGNFGSKTSDEMKEYILKNIGLVVQFPRILDCMYEDQRERTLCLLERIFSRHVVYDTKYTNVTEEIHSAVDRFKDHGCMLICYIADRSSVKLCLEALEKAKLDGIVPSQQMWYLTTP